MQIDRWLLTVLLLFILIETVGFVFRGTFAGASALFSLLFSFIFLGLQIFSYISCAFYAEVNPWVGNVERMEWHPFNPMYMIWLFENNRREWAAYTILINALLTLPLGSSLLLCLSFFTYGYVTFENSLVGFLIGCGFLYMLALSWYKGFWKPRTREPRVIVPDSVEAEWRDKRL